MLCLLYVYSEALYSTHFNSVAIKDREHNVHGRSKSFKLLVSLLCSVMSFCGLAQEIVSQTRVDDFITGVHYSINSLLSSTKTQRQSTVYGAKSPRALSLRQEARHRNTSAAIVDPLRVIVGQTRNQTSTGGTSAYPRQS